MARPLRIEFPGALYYLTARGDGREEIYLDGEDREQFLALLGGVCERFNWRCYSYCLMSNHYHLLMETPDGNLSRGMRQLNDVYAQRFNVRHERVGARVPGPLQGHSGRARPLSPGTLPLCGAQPLARGDGASCRSVALEQLPGDRRPAPYTALAGRVLGAWEVRPWPWSGDCPVQSVHAPRHEPIQPLEEGLRQQIYLGDEAFVTRMQAGFEEADLDEVPRAQRRPPALPLAEYAQRYPERRVAMATAYRSGDYTLKAIAEYFGVHYSTVSRALRQGKLSPGD